jgi:hypothetical protein
LNGWTGLFVATNARLLNIQNADKLFFHFFKNILNGWTGLFVGANARLLDI